MSYGRNLDTKTDQSWTSHLSCVQTRQMDVRVRGEINRSSGGETGLNTQIRSPSIRPFIYLSQLTMQCGFGQAPEVQRVRDGGLGYGDARDMDIGQAWVYGG